jgi:hypothetical protein
MGKGPSENPFPWQAPEGSVQVFSLRSFKAREIARKVKENFCLVKINMV